MSIDVEPGTYKVIRCDGSEETFQYPRGSTAISAVLSAIEAECVDALPLPSTRGLSKFTMVVDDTGLLDDKPVNAKATALYFECCNLGTCQSIEEWLISLYSIHGDVAIVRDADYL